MILKNFLILLFTVIFFSCANNRGIVLENKIDPFEKYEPSYRR